jgi:hypothetical protein
MASRFDVRYSFTEKCANCTIEEASTFQIIDQLSCLSQIGRREHPRVPRRVGDENTHRSDTGTNDAHDSIIIRSYVSSRLESLEVHPIDAECLEEKNTNESVWCTVHVTLWLVRF